MLDVTLRSDVVSRQFRQIALRLREPLVRRQLPVQLVRLQIDLLLEERVKNNSARAHIFQPANVVKLPGQWTGGRHQWVPKLEPEVSRGKIRHGESPLRAEVPRRRSAPRALHTASNARVFQPAPALTTAAPLRAYCASAWNSASRYRCTFRAAAWAASSREQTDSYRSWPARDCTGTESSARNSQSSSVARVREPCRSR